MVLRILPVTVLYLHIVPMDIPHLDYSALPLLVYLVHRDYIPILIERNFEASHRLYMLGYDP